MLKKYATTQTFKTNRSTLLIKWLLVIHTIAIFAATFNSLSVIYKLILATLILISLYTYLKHINPPLTIRHNANSGWEIAQSGKGFYAIEIMPSTVITPYIIVLHYKKQTDQKQTAVIFIDALAKDQFRKLRVELKVAGLSKESFEKRL